MEVTVIFHGANKRRSHHPSDYTWQMGHCRPCCCCGHGEELPYHVCASDCIRVIAEFVLSLIWVNLERQALVCFKYCRLRF